MTHLEAVADAQLAEYHPRLRRFFAARDCREASDDLAAEVMIRVLAAIRRGEPLTHVGAYALGVARLVLLEHFRARSRAPLALPEGWEPPVPEVEEPDQERLALLENCLQALAPADRDLLVRYHGEGKNKTNRARLAGQLGTSLNALGVRAFRIRAQVRDCIEARQRSATA